MKWVLGLEAIGLTTCVLAALWLFRSRSVLQRESRLLFYGLLLAAGLAHGLDLLEWAGSATADRTGDVVKVLLPATWLFFLVVTTRDRLLGQVDSQEQQLTFFLEEAPVAVAIVDAEFCYVACSKRWLELHELRAAPTGEGLADVVPELGRTWARIAHDSLERGETLSGTEIVGERIGQAEAGEGEWFEWRVRPFQLAQDAGGCILLVEPIGERVREQQAREEARERVARQQNLVVLGQVAAGVAHDLNNVLQVMTVHLDLLESSRPEAAAEAAELQGAVDTAAKMVRWLVTFGSNRQREPELVDLRDCLSRLWQLLARTLPLGQRLELLLPDEPAFAWIDSTLFDQMVINLVLNARDAMPQGGEVTVSLRIRSGQVSVIVADEGEGIPPRVRERILEPFFSTKGERGTGMGLAVVSRGAKVHQAKLTIESEPDRGATFTIDFPHPDRFDRRRFIRDSTAVRAGPSTPPGTERGMH